MANVISCPFAEDNSESIADQIATFPQRSACGLYGKARWARQRDIDRLTGPENRSHTPALESVTPIVEDPDTRKLKVAPQTDLYFTRQMEQWHTCVFGNTGSGKTQNFVNALVCDYASNRNVTLVAVVAKPETTELIREAVHLYRPDEDVYVWNPGNRHRSTVSYKPVFNSRTKHDPGLVLANATNFINASQNNHDSRDFFWTTSAARIVAGCILRGSQRFGDSSLADAHAIVELPLAKLVEFLESGPELPFANSTAHFLRNDGQNANTTLAFAQSYLRLFADEHVAAATCHDGLDLVQLVSSPNVLVIEIPMNDQVRCRPLVNCFIADLFAVATEVAFGSPRQRLPNPLRAVFDDCPLTTGQIPTFAEYLSLIRSLDVGVTAAMHSKASLEHFFGSEAELVLAGFNNQIYLSPIERYDADDASKKSGTMTAEVPGKGLVQRPLMTPDDIAMPFSDPVVGSAATFFLGNTPPFQAFVQPSYKSRTFGDLVRSSQNRSANEGLGEPLPLWKPKTDLLASANEATPAQLIRKRYAYLHALVCDQSSKEDVAWWKATEQNHDNDVEILLLPIQRMVVANVSFGDVRAAMKDRSSNDLLRAIAHAAKKNGT